MKPKRAYPEEAECRALMQWVRLNRKKHPELDLLIHIPNGGKRNPREAARFKAIGVKAGVLDYLLPVQRLREDNNWMDRCGLWLEMKTPGNYMTGPQQSWATAMRYQGYRVALCYSWQDAAQAIVDYLDN